MVELVLCGRGGQGIVFLTRQIGQIATAKGLNVVSSETHGMAVRGGSINSHLRIGPLFLTTDSGRSRGLSTFAWILLKRPTTVII